MVPAEKKNRNEVRVYLDLNCLNEAVKHERCMLPTLEDITPKLAGARVFSTLDALNGFWSSSSKQKKMNFYHTDGQVLLLSPAVWDIFSFGNLPKADDQPA